MASLLGAGSGGREYVLKIVADVRDAVKGVDEVATKTTSMKDKMLGIGKGVAAGLATAAVVEFGRQSVNAAAEADDAMDAVVSAFGSGSQAVIDFSKTTADKMGLSSQDYQRMAAETGRVLTGFGIDNKTAADSTNKLAMRAADMAAIVGGTTEEAMSAIDKALMGQTKGLKKYQVSISNAEIEARAMAKGYVDASGKVTDAGKAIAAQDLILEKTARYQGEFAKNSGDLGSQQEILKAKFENLQTELGTKLLPIIVKLMETMQPFLDLIVANIDWLAPLAGIIAGVVVAIKLWTIAQGIFNVVMMANPIFLVAAAIAALIALIVVAYMKVDWFRDAVDAMADGIVAAFQWIWDAAKGVFNWIKDNWPLLLAILTGPFGTAVYFIIKYWDEIKSFFSDIPHYINVAFSALFDILIYPWKRAAEFVLVAWGAVKDFFYKLPGWINGFFKGLFEILIYPFKRAGEFIVALFGGILDWFYRLPGRINGMLGGLGDIIIWPFKKAWGYIDGTFGRVVDFIYKLPGYINTAWSNLADIIMWPFKKAFEGIKWIWNNTLGRLHFTIPSWIPFGLGGKEFGFPKLAKGGVVNRPTLAVIGESGPEAVVPLSKYGMAQPMGANVTLNVYALTANSEVGRLVYNALRDYERTSGSRIFASPVIPSGF